MSDYKQEIRRALLEHVEAQVVFGDTKAALIVAADAILITGYVAGIKEFGLAGIFSHSTIWWLTASLFILVGGLVLALVAVMPNIRHWRPPANVTNILLFSRIARYKTPEDYAEEFNGLNDEALSNAILFQVYGKSKWALFKYKLIWLSVALTIISLSSATIAILIDLLG